MQNFNWRWRSYALRRCVRYSFIYEAHMSKALNESSALQHLECGNVIKICNGIMFDFYPGMPHLQTCFFQKYQTTIIWEYSCNLLSLSSMETVAFCNLSVTAVSLVVRATVNDFVSSTTWSSRMGMVITWVGMETLKVRVVVTVSYSDPAGEMRQRAHRVNSIEMLVESRIIQVSRKS